LIAQLTGTVARVVGSAVVLDVNGVGYRVAVPVSVLEQLPIGGTEKVTLVTHLQVREDDLSLYGFLDDTNLKVFELLLTVSGVGPKVALALLSALSAEDLARAVSANDTRTLTRVPGVGARTAQRIALDLKEKFAALGFERRVETIANREAVRQGDAGQDTLEDVVSALENLGYNKNDARRAADSARAEITQAGRAVAFPDLLRNALNRLTKG
jgi:holliday junction DNA helicase RuvA